MHRLLLAWLILTGTVEARPTALAHRGDAKGFTVEIGSREGAFQGMPMKRSILVRLRTARPMGKATLDGVAMAFGVDDGAAAVRVEEIPGKKRVLSVAWA